MNPTISKVYKETMVQLKFELRKIELTRWGSNFEEKMRAYEDRIKNILYKIAKLKEINLYFQDFRKEEGLLEADVEKFLFYKPKDNK